VTVSGIIFPIAFDHFVDAGVSVSQSAKCVSLSRGDVSHGNHIKMLSVHNLLFIFIYTIACRVVLYATE